MFIVFKEASIYDNRGQILNFWIDQNYPWSETEVGGLFPNEVTDNISCNESDVDCCLDTLYDTNISLNAKKSVRVKSMSKTSPSKSNFRSSSSARKIKKWYFVAKIVLTYSHCAFSSNLFHGYLAQILINQLSDPENKKCSPWKVFGKNHPQILLLLSRRGPRSPEARLSQHYIGPKMTFQHFSNFCRKKFPGLTKRLLHNFIQF